MRPTTTKTAAIRFAEDHVSMKPYRFGESYRIAYFDPLANRWRESTPSTFPEACAQRRQRLAILACHHLGVEPPSEVVTGDMTGRWKDYVPNPATVSQPLAETQIPD